MLEEEVDAERGDVGERRGLLTRSRENGGARKVSDPFQMFWCFQRVKERRGIKLLPWKRSACWHLSPNVSTSVRIFGSAEVRHTTMGTLSGF